MPDAIVLRGLTKTFGDTVAVRDFDLVVPQGALYGVIGPNGAGKTTTIRMILSILLPDRGELSVLGQQVGDGGQGPDRLPPRGARPLQAHARRPVPRLHGPPQERRRRRPATRASAAWLERVDLGGVENKRCEELSKGMQQKVQFLAAIIHRPDLLILDEPFSGLDPVNQRLLRELVDRGAPRAGPRCCSRPT